MRPFGLALLIMILCILEPVQACPVCDSETGAQVRAGVINQQLGSNLLAVAAPFLLLGALVAVVHFIPGRRRTDGKKV